MQSSVGSPSPHVDAIITINELSLNILTSFTSATFITFAFKWSFSVASFCKALANSSAVPISVANKIVKEGINSG